MTAPWGVRHMELFMSWYGEAYPDVRLIRMPREMSDHYVLSLMRTMEDYVVRAPLVPIVLLCDAEEGEMTEATLKAARHIYGLHQKGARLLTVVGKRACPPAMLLFATGRRRVMHKDATLDFQEVKWRAHADRLSALTSRAQVLESNVGAFFDRISGAPKTFAGMFNESPDKAPQRVKADNRRIEANRMKRQAEIAALRVRIAELEPQQKVFVDFLVKVTGGDVWAEKRYWGCRAHVVDAHTCWRHGLADAEYAHPLDWVEEIGHIGLVRDERLPRYG